jgi:hypothetical protein
MLGLGGAGVLWASRAQHLTASLSVLVAAGVVALTSIVFLLVRSGRDVEIEARDRELEREVAADVQVPHPYRQLARHMALRVSPKVSAGGVAFALGASMLASAILFPAVLHLPRWVEMEVVLGAWWLIVTAVLSTLLYRGYRLKDDWAFTSPLRSLWAKDPPRPGAPAREKGSSWNGGCDPGCGDFGCSSAADEGILIVIGVVVIAILLFGAGWVLVEIAMPLVLFAVYSGMVAALKRVAHDRHGCEGDLAKAIPWGAFWASLYLLPAAALVWALLVYVVG